MKKERKKNTKAWHHEKSGELDQFFSISLDMLCVANTEGYFVRLNPAFENILGYTTQELMAKPFVEFVHPDDREATLKAMATSGLQGIVHELTNRYRCKDGSYRWLEWRAVPSGNLIYASARDVTERVKSKRQLEERLQFETLLVELSGRFVNVPSQKVDTEIAEVMQKMCEHLDIDLAGLWQLTETDPQFFILTHLFRSLEGPPIPERTDSKDLFPWCHEQIVAGNTVIIPSTEDMPEEAVHDQEVLRHYGIKSFITFPLSAGGVPVVGALSFNSIRQERMWPEEIVKRLRLVAEIFANALIRKKSEQNLRESEERLSLASGSAGIGLWILDLNTHQFWATDKALELFGLAPECTLDFDTYIKLVHHEDRDRVLQALNQASQSDADVMVEYRIIKTDNSIRWLSSRGRRQLNSTGEVERLMGVTLDITEWKRAEDLRAEAQSLVDALLESTEDMIWSVDPQRFGLLTFNSALRDYFLRDLGLKITLGMSPEDMVTGAFTPLVAEKWRQLYLRALREGSFTEEYRVATGTKVLLLSFSLLKQSGELFGISVFGKDITERKNMEQKIQRAAREWQTTFDNIPDLVMILDTEFRIVRINAAVRSYFGLPKEEIIGAHCYALLHGEEKPGDYCPYMKTLESKDHEEAEFHDDTRKVWLRASTDPVVDDSGEVVQIIYTLKDITEQKRAEAEAFAARKELWRTDRLLRMGELTASLAHELNQPLTAILSNARAAIRFIKSGRIDMNELTEILEDIAKDDKRAGDIIRSLRSMLKPDEGEPEVIDINDLLGETVALFNSEAIIRNIRIEKRFAESLPSVVANRIQLQQVVINLLMNAAESIMDINENRKIVMETCTINDDRVRVAVRDYGAGVDEHDLGRIFEPFFTTKRTGLGMGLSLARSIIEGQAGHIWAENNSDGGATFYFELPGVRQ